MRITPFDIPLLNSEICQYLSCKDLAHCVQVSKAWTAWFTPALWRDLDWPDILTSTRQQEHIQGVRCISMRQMGPILALQSCTNLQRLDFKDHDGDQLQVLQVLGKISTLRHLQITLVLEDDNICQQWIRVLEALPRLESLILKSGQLADGKFIQKMLQLCIGYKRLAFTFIDEETYARNEQDYQDTRAAIERMPDMQPRELSLNSRCEHYETNIFQPLLDRCPRIEKLTLCSTLTLQHLSKALKEKRLAQLRHLAVRTYAKQSCLAELLSYDEGGLESFEVATRIGKQVAQSLIQYHHQSLRRLRFGQTGILLSALSEVMTALPNLRSLEATVLPLYEGDITNIPLDKHWVCLGLRVLRLKVETRYYHGTVGSTEWVGSMHKRGIDYVFSETAKMKSLQDLSIGCRQKGLYLMQSGYLTQLGDLKQLEVFDLASTPPEEFGRDEALWMASNWPRLIRVQSHGASEIFRQTLLEERPLLEIVN
ncbi:MAG: hypothetical protein J3Q66DRAFT_330938 [Benniella sp.]|nr:MAG: hypothetical protein J3Q66DRAFT_330938 [Benniella sp.]